MMGFYDGKLQEWSAPTFTILDNCWSRDAPELAEQVGQGRGIKLGHKHHDTVPSMELLACITERDMENSQEAKANRGYWFTELSL